MKIYYILLLFLISYNSILPQNTNVTTFVFDTVVVTTSKYEKNIDDLPYSSAVVDVKKINKSTSQSISELLKAEPGLTLVRDGIWGTEISIRGMSRSNIVTLIDGNRIETSNDVSARLSMIDINDIDKIEVIKGAASTLYGTGATGGIINVISKKEKYSNNFIINGSFTSGFNSVNSNFLSGINISASSNNWTSRIAGSFRKAGNTKTPLGTLNNSQFEDNSLNGALSIKPFEHQELVLNYQQFNAADVGIPGAYPLFPNNAKVSYPEEKRKMFSAAYNISNISVLLKKLTAKYYHQYILRDVENIPNQVQNIPAGNALPQRKVSVLEINPTAKHFTNGFQVQSDLVLGKTHYLIAGFDYWKRSYNGERTRSQKIEVLNSDGTATVKTTYKKIIEKPLPDADFSSAGFFLQDEMQVIEKKLNVTIGGRFDLINIKNEETKNPLYDITDGVINNKPSNQTIIWKSGEAKNTSYAYNAGLLYSISEHSILSLNAARSFRSPSLEERYQYIDQGNIIRIGDPQLKPEKGYFFDLGFRITNKNFRTKTSLFYNYLNDLVTEVPATYDNRSAYKKVNIGKASLYGFELEVNHNFTNLFMLYSSLSYVQGKNLKDNVNLPQIPPLNGISGIKFTLINSVETDFSVNYFASQNKTAPGEISTPGYAVFNINLNSNSVKLGLLNFRFYAGVENILNKGYRNHLSTNRGLITSEPGRNIYIKTNISW